MTAPVHAFRSATAVTAYCGEVVRPDPANPRSFEPGNAMPVGACRPCVVAYDRVTGVTSLVLSDLLCPHCRDWWSDQGPELVARSAAAAAGTGDQMKQAYDALKSTGEAMLRRCCRGREEMERFRLVGAALHATADRLISAGYRDPRTTR